MADAGDVKVSLKTRFVDPVPPIPLIYGSGVRREFISCHEGVMSVSLVNNGEFFSFHMTLRAARILASYLETEAELFLLKAKEE